MLLSQLFGFRMAMWLTFQFFGFPFFSSWFFHQRYIKKYFKYFFDSLLYSESYEQKYVWELTLKIQLWGSRVCQIWKMAISSHFQIKYADTITVIRISKKLLRKVRGVIFSEHDLVDHLGSLNYLSGDLVKNCVEWKLTFFIFLTFNVTS